MVFLLSTLCYLAYCDTLLFLLNALKCMLESSQRGGVLDIDVVELKFYIFFDVMPNMNHVMNNHNRKGMVNTI